MTISSASAQSAEAEQLLLNVEKLSQLKSILKDMKAGYQVLSKGYSTVRNISRGNFSLHQAFLGDLLRVSPAVKKYHKVAEILTLQISLSAKVNELRRQVERSGKFSTSELRYFSQVCASMLSSSLANLDELLMVLSSSSLRMNDSERLSSIDRLSKQATELELFFRYFSAEAASLARKRKKEQGDLSIQQQLNSNRHEN